MRLVDLDQNTQDWLEQRKRFLGGSDIPSVMCVSPWRTVFQLWEEKLKICSPDQASKAYIFWKGHRYENIARQAYELRIGFDIPAQVVQHETIPWARVSLDCFNWNKGFLGEVKFMGKDSWLLLKELGEVPDHYYPQIQYQMFCTGIKKIHFIGINEQKQLAVKIVDFDPEYAVKMIAWCSHFWELREKRIAPKRVQQDYKRLMRKRGVTACNRIFSIDAKIKKLFEERDALQKEVQGLARSTRMVFQGKMLIKVGDFDSKRLEAIDELKELDLSHLGRSISDNLELIIIKNNTKHIKGAPNGSKKVKRKSKSKSKTSTKTSTKRDKLSATTSTSGES